MRVDYDTIACAQTGDHDALEAIVRATYDYVMGFVVRRASNYDYAEEATAETYLILLLEIARYVPTRPIEQWLCGIARNRLFKIERRERYRAHPRVHPKLPSPFDVEREVEERLSIERVRRTLSALTPLQASVLEMRIVGGLDTAATAARLGVTRSTVKSAKFHGLERLRERIGGYT